VGERARRVFNQGEEVPFNITYQMIPNLLGHPPVNMTVASKLVVIRTDIQMSIKFDKADRTYDFYEPMIIDVRGTYDP
jgi:hypothetical protein